LGKREKYQYKTVEVARSPYFQGRKNVKFSANGYLRHEKGGTDGEKGKRAQFLETGGRDGENLL